MNPTLTLLRGEPTGTSAPERRQEERLQANVPGEIKIIDKTGRLAIEDIWIDDWSETGCRFEAGIPLQAGEIVAIKALLTDETAMQGEEPQLFEIAWTNRRVAFWAAGAIKLQGEKLKSIKFPWSAYAAEKSPR
jgi:hypothetical protein